MTKTTNHNNIIFLNTEIYDNIIILLILYSYIVMFRRWIGSSSSGRRRRRHNEGENSIPRRLSYWTLRRFMLNTLSNGDNGGRVNLATLVEIIANHYGTRAFLASPRNERNLTDIINVLLLSKRFRLMPA